MTKKLSIEDKEFIKEFYPIFGWKYCAKKLNKNKGQIQNYASDHKIKKNINHKCNINDYFNIFTPDVIYILGFLWADGNIKVASKNSYIINLTVTKDDSIYLKPLLEKWSPLKWGEYERGAQYKEYSDRILKGRPSTNFYLCDKFFSNFLVDHDYRDKSFMSADKILSIIPENLKHYWWRGYFDGDGSFYFNERVRVVSIAGHSKQDWSFLFNLCQSLGVKCQSSIWEKKIGSCSRVDIRKKNDCIKFLEYIYQNREEDQIGYSRKFNNYKKAALKPVNYSSDYEGVSFKKKKKKSPWIYYYKGKYLGCSDSQEESRRLREDYIKKIENEITKN
jgi:hypothetical protein